MVDDTGSVVTVDGPIDPEELGVTLAHGILVENPRRLLTFVEPRP